MKPVELIVAVDKYGGFGKDGEIPWNFPEDLKHFRQITVGGICIMGRVTHTDMVKMAHARRLKDIANKNILTANKGNPRQQKKKAKKAKTKVPAPRPCIKNILKDRESFVLTSNEKYDAEGATRATNLRNVIEDLPTDDTRTIFVIGGESLYNTALIWTNKIHMTIIPENYECDKFFNLDYLMKNFKIRERKRIGKLMFVTYHRIAK